MATKLLTELQNGVAQFRVRGKVSINENTFADGVQTSNSGWVYERVGFAVKVGETNSTYVGLMGGHASEEPVVYVQNKDHEPIQIKWDLRLNETVLENVAPYSFVRIAVETDVNDELIRKQFISEMDAIDYLRDHLEDGMDVDIAGNVEYQRYNGEIQRSLNITRITRILRDEYKPVSQIHQTYLLDQHSTPAHWEKKLREDGSVKINAFVPQYVGKENGKKIKKTLAMPQQFTVEANDENIEKRIKIVEKFLKPSKGVVREIVLNNNLVFGFAENKGNFEMTPELQELIDLGLSTKEELEEEVTVSGRRIDETIFGKPAIQQADGELPKIMMADKYSPEALVVAEPEEDHVEDDKIFGDDTTSNDEEEDLFSDDDLFG